MWFVHNYNQRQYSSNKSGVHYCFINKDGNHGHRGIKFESPKVQKMYIC